MPGSNAGDVHRRLVELYPRVLAGDLEEALDLIAEDVVDHRGGSQGDHVGRDAWRAKWTALSGGAADVEVVIEQNISDAESSANRYTSRGRDVPTGRRYEVTGLDMVRVRDGRVVEHWAVMDTDALRAQVAG